MRKSKWWLLCLFCKTFMFSCLILLFSHTGRSVSATALEHVPDRNYAFKGNWFQGYLITISSCLQFCGVVLFPGPKMGLHFLPLYSIFSPDTDDTQGKYLHFLRMSLFGQRRPVMPKLLQNMFGKYSGGLSIAVSFSKVAVYLKFS